MSPAETVYRPISPTWPVWVALAAFAGLIVVLLAIDLRVARDTARRIDDVVENAARSIDLVDDLRDEVRLLSDPTITPEEANAARRRLAHYSFEYDALAGYPGEAAEWQELKLRLAAIEKPGAHVTRVEIRQVSEAVDRLVEINRNAARAHEEMIAAIHRSASVADATVGAIALALAGAIAWWLLRVLARQRQLVAQHIALLDARNRELDAFAARAAHDLRVPLNPLRGYADLLATGTEPPEEVREMAGRIALAVQRMARTIDDMLELSRTSAPRVGASAELARVVADVLDERKAELADADVQVAAADGTVGCSAGVLALILRNLVGNAIKFRSRERRLTLQLASRAVDGAVEIVVADNGVGMDADSVTHAFEPGYRGRGEREIPGHGLGLAIVERATRTVGGECSITSVPDKGTTVTLRLPRGAGDRDMPPR
jgi:signal transduction histidine kinase